ncbi:hypothetical protein AFR_18820 [Actinoplanes friuliensis DSM 7358]|uniref:Uncharacterized protein n=1 Tax=Actinoplanes friuliensis DSM 7358 TaxID=1246995 RepID=U5W256_9ACTN|nr:hypothetical protein AFR_18820 [Actinoplanes friuliensis DSM 7358]
MRCSRPSWRRRNARLSRSDFPLSDRYEPSRAVPGSNGTGPPRRGAAFAGFGDGDALFDGLGDGFADGLAEVADGVGEAVVGSAAAGDGGAGSAEQAAGRVSAARASTERRGSRRPPGFSAVMSAP